MAPIFDLSPMSSLLDDLLATSKPPFSLDNLSPLLRLPKASRSTHAEQLNAKIETFEETLKMIDVVHTKLIALRATVNSWRGRVSYSTSHVSALPVELLSSVFELAVPQWTDRSIDAKASLRISHVSSHWRAVALGNPQLWTKLLVKSFQNTHLLDVLLPRLGPLKLRLEVRSHEYEDVDDAKPAFQVVLRPEIVDRLDCLHVLGDAKAPCVIFSSPDHRSVPKLELTASSTDPLEYNATVEELTLNNCELYMRSRGQKLPFHRLARLKLVEMELEDVLRMLQASGFPVLRHLILGHITDYEQASRLQTPIQFPKLESLSLLHYVPVLWTRLVQTSMPALRRLSINLGGYGSHREVLDVLTPFLRAHGSGIKVLRLLVSNYNYGCVTLVGTTGNQQPLCPQLTTLRVDHRKTTSIGPRNEQWWKGLHEALAERIALARGRLRLELGEKLVPDPVDSYLAQTRHFEVLESSDFITDDFYAENE